MDRLDRYELIDRLGAGGFATVFRAYDPRLDDEVAVKVLADNWSSDPDIRERFIREARVMRRLEHRRLVRVYDIGEVDGRPYFVMRLVRGGTLHTRIEEWRALHGPTTAADARRLVIELAEALEVVHRAGIVHRDIKPSNLLIDVDRPNASNALLGADEHVLLGDFGLARDGATGASRLTIAGGSTGFAAPEQLVAHGQPDARTDLYAASAVVAWFTSDWHRTPELTGAIDRGMAHSPDDRYGTSEEWEDAFMSALAAGTRADRGFRSGSVRRPRRRTARTAIAAAVVAFVAGGGALWWTQVRQDVSIDGPQTAVAGQVVTYHLTLETPTRTVWTESQGSSGTGDTFTFEPVVPGEVVVQAVAGDPAVTYGRTLVVTPAADAPRIIGPDRIDVGESGRYVVDTDDALQVTWFVGDQQLDDSELLVEPTNPGTLDIRVLVTRSSGEQIGSLKRIELNP